MTRKRGKQPLSKSLQNAFDDYIGDDPELQAVYEQTLADSEVAR